MRRAQWIILGEDKAHLSFVLHWLKARGVPRGAIFERPVPAGRGAGEQFVRERLPIELRALRRRPGQAIVLVVVTDADSLTVEGRIAALGQDLSGDRERVALLIPRRNIETWIAALGGEAVDEVSDYKRRSGRDDCRAAAQKLAALAQIPGSAPDSLRRAFGELARCCVS